MCVVKATEICFASVLVCQFLTVVTCSSGRHRWTNRRGRALVSRPRHHTSTSYAPVWRRLAGLRTTRPQPASSRTGSPRLSRCSRPWQNDACVSVVAAWRSSCVLAAGMSGTAVNSVRCERNKNFYHFHPFMHTYILKIMNFLEGILYVFAMQYY